LRTSYGDAGGAEERTGEPVRDRVLARQDADRDHAVDEDAVPGQQPVAVDEDAPRLLERCRRARLHVRREVVRHAAEAAPGDREARARDRLDEVVEELARLEHVERRPRRRRAR
jgi:hypothetical protein